jgi:hypothetical protein
MESLNDWRENQKIQSKVHRKIHRLLTFLMGVPPGTLAAFCPWSFNEFKLSLDCPFEISLSEKPFQVHHQLQQASMLLTIPRRPWWRRHPRSIHIHRFQLGNFTGRRKNKFRPS